MNGFLSEIKKEINKTYFFQKNKTIKFKFRKIKSYTFVFCR